MSNVLLALLSKLEGGFCLRHVGREGLGLELVLQEKEEARGPTVEW